jgi:threonine aldolase
MKTLEERAKELALQAAVKEKFERDRANREAAIAKELAWDIQNFAGNKAQVAVTGNMITVEKVNRDVMRITVSADEDVMFSVSARNVSATRCDEDAVLESILNWLA